MRRAVISTVVVSDPTGLTLAKEVLARTTGWLRFDAEARARLDGALEAMIDMARAEGAGVRVELAVEPEARMFEMGASPAGRASRASSELAVPAPILAIADEAFVETSGAGERIVARIALPDGAPDVEERSRPEPPVNQELVRALVHRARAEAKLQLAASIADLGFVERDAVTGVVRLDERAQRLLSVDAPELSSTDALVALIADLQEREIAARKLEIAAAATHPLGFVLQFRIDDRWLIIRGLAEPEADGTHVSAAVLDVSALKHQEEEARDRARFHQEMIGIASHDLKSPLNVVSMGVTLLREVGTLDERQLELVRRIDRANRRGAQLIADLLDFTQVRLAGALPIRPRASSLLAVVNQVVDEARLVHRDFDFVVSELGSSKGTFDPDRIAQAAGNLIANAVEHADDAEVRVVVTATDTHLGLAVENGGPPIPADALEEIFEPMQRKTRDGSEKRRIGLGLYIVRAIARAHGGDAFVEKSDDALTRFVMRIPVDPPQKS